MSKLEEEIRKSRGREMANLQPPAGGFEAIQAGLAAGAAGATTGVGGGAAAATGKASAAVFWMKAALGVCVLGGLATGGWLLTGQNNKVETAERTEISQAADAVSEKAMSTVATETAETPAPKETVGTAPASTSESSSADFGSAQQPPAPRRPENLQPSPPNPQPATPQPATPQPATPQLPTPQLATPQPATPQPATPQPATPQPATPQPATPPVADDVPYAAAGPVKTETPTSSPTTELPMAPPASGLRNLASLLSTSDSLLSTPVSLLSPSVSFATDHILADRAIVTWPQGPRAITMGFDPNFDPDAEPSTKRNRKPKGRAEWQFHGAVSGFVGPRRFDFSGGRLFERTGGIGNPDSEIQLPNGEVVPVNFVGFLDGANTRSDNVFFRAGLTRQTHWGGAFRGSIGYYSGKLSQQEDLRNLEPNQLTTDFSEEEQVGTLEAGFQYTFLRRHRFRPYLGINAIAYLISNSRVNETIFDGQTDQLLNLSSNVNSEPLPFVPEFSVTAGFQYRFSPRISAGAFVWGNYANSYLVEAPVGIEVRYAFETPGK